MTCKHHYIRTWVFEDTGQPSGLWSCVDCSLKFEPITQRTAAVGENSKAWVGLSDDELSEIMRINYARTIPLIAAVEAKLRSKNGY